MSNDKGERKFWAGISIIFILVGAWSLSDGESGGWTAVLLGIATLCYSLIAKRL